MDGPTDAAAWKREQKQTELAARISQKGDLKLKLEHFIQTRQDTTSVTHEIAEIDAEIARLEEELRLL